MNIDDIVRDALHSHADDAPPSAGLLAATHTRARRRRMQHAAVAVAVGITTGLVALSIPFGASVGEGPTVPGSDPPAFPPVELAAAPDFELPSFPFTPGWTPAEMKPPFVRYNFSSVNFNLSVELDGRIEQVAYSEAELGLVQYPERPISHRTVTVDIHPEDPTPSFENIPEEPVTVQDRQGTRYQVDGWTFVIWEHDPDQWVVVWGWGVDVERYAQELDETPIQPAAPFTFDLLPAGVELTGFAPDFMQFHRSDGVSVHVGLERPDSTGFSSGSPGPTEPSDGSTGSPGPTEPSDVPTGDPQSPEPDPSASGEPGHFPSPPPAQPIPTEVDGRQAQLLQWNEGTELRVRLGDGMVLKVTGFQMNPEDLIRVAEGIELTE